MNQALTWLDPLQVLNCVVMLLLANEANDEAMHDAAAARIRTKTSSANDTAVDDGDGMYSNDIARKAAASRYLPAASTALWILITLNSRCMYPFN